MPILVILGWRCGVAGFLIPIWQGGTPPWPGQDHIFWYTDVGSTCDAIVLYLVTPRLTFSLRRCLCRCLVAEGGSTVPIDGGSASESMATQESRQFDPGSWFGRHPGNSRSVSSPSCPRHECSQAPVHLHDFQERKNRRGTSTEKCRPILLIRGEKKDTL